MRRTNFRTLVIFAGTAMTAILAVASVQASERLLDLAGVRGSIGMRSSTLHLHEDWGPDLPVRDTETIRKTFELTATQKSLQLDNVNGSVEIVGTDSNQVQLVVNKTIQAKDAARLEQARKEVTLDIKNEAGFVRLYVDGPFRCNCGDRRNVNFQRHPGYWVRMDFQLQVPRNIDLEVSTVNDGEVRVRDVKGSYDVSNVNGGIEMTRVAGSGKAHTVNGAVKVRFTENPRERSSFQSINGNVELFFVRGLSADFRLKNFNGGIYTDFQMTSLPFRNVNQERRGGKTIIRTDRFMGGRVGNGGAEIEVENLNGDIKILENQP